MLIAILALTATQAQVTLPSPTLRYRVEAKTTLDQDLSTIGRGKLTGSLATTAILSVTMTDSADGQIVRVTVDSMKLEPVGAMAVQLTPAAAAAAADSVRGASVRAYSVRGTLRGVPQPSVPNPALATVMQALGVMFPGLRSGIKVGDSWADTTKIDGDVKGGHQLGSIIAAWSVTGVEDGGLVLEGTSATKVTTTGQNGQSLTVSGGSKEHLVLAPRGPSRRASIESTSDASTVQKLGGAPIPSRTTATLRITPLP